ncbi:hypothetical protein T484DRAFT_3631362 [Baffinella frigidus]|nr:hypothetical protein T484DRAFT_3631362 [Cryptophyta sp. CCMP2293]
MLCKACKKPTTDCCSVCKTVYYCGRRCQPADWNEHRKSCKTRSDTLVVEHTDKVRATRAAESSARAAVKSVVRAARAEAITETDVELLRLRKVLEEETAASAARAAVIAETDAEILRLQKELQQNERASVMYRHLASASRTRNWSSVVLWTPHAPDLVYNKQLSAQEQILHMFTFAMRKRYEATACDKYQHNYEEMTFMRIGLLGQIMHFRDQAALLCQKAEEKISEPFDAVRFDSAAGLFKKAHKIAEEHGFISIESRVWAGRGQMSWCGYAGLEPWRKNDCRHYPVLNYEGIMYLRNAVCPLQVPRCVQVPRVHARATGRHLEFVRRGGDRRARARCQADRIMCQLDRRLRGERVHPARHRDADVV